MKFLCEQCKAKYQIADEKAVGKTVRMKCRKCGYLIEVRAAATEAGSSSPPRATASKGSVPVKAAAADAPVDRAGPLASAMKTALQREDEVSAPVDMSDLSPSDEWYVAINGVPVGPIRIGEVRRKAAIGAVTDESLCWQEGLDEWRPLRSFPELAAFVREAFGSGRPSMTPQPSDGRASLPPQTRTSIRPSPPVATGTGPVAFAPRMAAQRPASGSPSPPGARSNVVPISSRLAAAERLADPSDGREMPVQAGATILAPSVVPDPFGAPPRALTAPTGAPMDTGAAGSTAAMAPASFGYAPPRPSGAPGPSQAYAIPAKKGPPWMAIAMVAMASSFGVTTAVVFMLPRAAPAPAVIVQVPGAPSATVATASSAAAPAAGTDTAGGGVVSMGAPLSNRSPASSGGGAKAATSSVAAAAPAHGPLDLKGLTGGAAPIDDTGGAGDGPKAPGQCLSEGQVRQVIGLHSVGLRRACWERSPSQKQSANVTVSLTIGGDGSAQGVSAAGDEPSVASCIAGDVRNWRFPAMGCSQQTSIPFHFVRQ